MFTNSIRWRLQLWLGLLLAGVLAAFGATSWQLEKTERIGRLDKELERRATALGMSIRGNGEKMFTPGRMNAPDGGPPGRGGPRGPRRPGGPPDDDFDFGPGGPPPDDRFGPGGPGRRPPPPPDDEYRGEFVEGDHQGPRGDGPPDMDLPAKRVSASVEAMFPEDSPEGYYYAIWTGSWGAQGKSALAPAEVPLPPSDGRNTQTQFRDRDGLREAYQFTERGECVLAGRSVRSDLAGMGPYGWRLSLTGLAILALGLGGGWFLTSRSIRPIEQISEAARRISDGNLSERIPVGRRGNELTQLATVLNSTFSRLEESFAQQKRFTADASHELRTPLTVLITETQSALSRERSADDYKEALSGNLETARRMKRLAEALLELARLDAGNDASHDMDFDLGELAGNVLAKLAPLAAARETELIHVLNAAPTKGSPDRLTLVITNLIENAIHHGKAAGKIQVKTWEEDGKVCLSVSDNGPGIAAEDLPHLFERFYRADKSRTGSKGRYGLGLAICRGMVEAEGGTITVESTKGEGASFTVRLPRSKP